MALTHQTRVQFPDGEWSVPPELRWQSGRLLTDRSLVRSQVVATRQFLPFFSAGVRASLRRGLAWYDDTTNPWRNGSASDSRPEGWGFKSLWVHSFLPFLFFFPRARASFLFFVSDLPETLPPELRWQSGRLLTDRSLVRSQVVAHYFSLPFCIVFLQLHPFESAHCFSCLRHFTKLVVTLQ